MSSHDHWLTSILYSDFLSIYPRSFYVPGLHPGYHITFSCHVSRAPCAVLLIFLGFNDLDSYDRYWSGVLQNVPPLKFVRSFSYGYTGVNGFGGGWAQRQSAIFITLIQRVHTANMTYSHWSSGVCSILYSLEGSSHLRSGELCFTSFRMEYPHKLFGLLLHGRFIFFSLMYLSMQSFIYISRDSLIFILCLGL
jgi:hypothetical protein